MVVRTKLEQEMNKMHVPPAPIVVDKLEGSEDEVEEKVVEKNVVVAYDQVRKRARLHSRCGCYRGRKLLFGFYETFTTISEAKGKFDDFCRTCWPHGDEKEENIEEAEDSDTSGDMD